MKTEQPKRWLKRIVLGLLGLAALTASVLANSGHNDKTPGRGEDSGRSPAGHGFIYQDA